MSAFFSLLVVSLDPGKKLKETIESIRRQTCGDYQIIIQDGMSSDNSIEALSEAYEKEPGSAADIKIFREKDTGIYDAMNRALKKAEGEYVFFLNCGDLFYNERVLQDVKEAMAKKPGHRVYYGNIYERTTGQIVASNPALDAFGCYRNVPCHQACFYQRELLLAHPFETIYRVRADYEQFLWCFFKGQADPLYMAVVTVDYEGEGFSESRDNLKISAAEHKEIVKKYMSPGQIRRFRLLLLLTLSPLRTRLSANPVTAGWYNRLKKRLYRFPQ